MDEENDGEDNDSNTADTVVRLIPMEAELGEGSSLVSSVDENDDVALQEKEIKETCAEKSGRYAKMILPHVGLVLLLTAYTLCGAGIFHMIELPHEEQVRNNALQKIILAKELVLHKLWNKSISSDLDEDTWKSMAFDQFQILEKILYQAYANEFVNLFDISTGLNGTTRRPMWTMPQAIFFSTTVLTMIGYGNLVPRTMPGRIFCIIFALFGIPLLLVTVADIGKFLADLIKFLYNSYQTCKQKVRQTRRRLLKFRKKGDKIDFEIIPGKKTEMRLPWLMVMLVVVTYTALGALLFHFYEGWDYFESFYFCFITMATVGFGDIVPTQEVYMFFTIAFIVIGLALTTMCIDLAGLEYVEKIHSIGQKIDVAKGVVGGAVVSGLHAGEHLWKIRVPTYRGGGLQLPAGMTEEEYLSLRHRGLGSLHYNVLSSPISPEVQRLLKQNKIKIRIEELKESDAYILENITFSKPLGGQAPPGPYKAPRGRRRRGKTRQEIERRLSRSQSWSKKPLAQDDILLLAPFLLKESDV